MIQVTVQDILTLSIDDLEALDPDFLGYCIYLIRDAETVLYIGRSSDPIERLMQHFGRARRSSGASIGMFYQVHKDLSTSWSIDIYTLAECEQILKRDLQWGRSPDAERYLIQHFHPCVNEMNNPYPGSLPEHYQKHKLNLDDTAVDYIHL